MPTSQSWRSLDAYSLGYVIGWKIVEENVAGFSEVIGVKDADTMFKLLNAGRFNTAVYGKLIGEKLIEENELLNVRMSHVLTTQPMYLYIHQKHKHLLPQLNELITKLNASA